ncbi:MAG: NAD(P)H-hydrate dehydratase [Chthoniobacterales bacterium]
MNSLVVSAAEMRAAEEAAFARGVSAEALMDQAAAGIADTVVDFFPEPGRCVVFGGKGNNGGDAFAAAQILRARGWATEVRPIFPEAECSELGRKKLRALRAAKIPRAQPTASHTVILDGLLGLGTKPPLRDPIRGACREINELRHSHHAFVVAVDLPSGLDGDSGAADKDAVVADLTVTIGATKRGLVADRALDFVGRLELVALDELECGAARADTVATARTLRGLLPPRSFGAYKNQFGRIGIVAGSKGFTGAAVLCSLGALRAGAGLVELFVPEDIYPILASAVAPEVMVKPVASYRDLLDEPIDLWAVGPGLGQIHAEEILALIENAKQPMVLDADGLNIVAKKMSALERAAGSRLLTPHPGEMKRLFPLENVSRAEHARQFTDKYKTTLLFKGSRTIVAEKGKPLSYNGTGNPGMATGGMGDVLTGVCAALWAQKLNPFDAARLGAWVCGRAAELAIFHGHASEQSLLPTDLVHHLGAAFNSLRA